MGMRKVTFVLAVVLAMLIVAGCSQSPGSQQAFEDQQQNEELQQKVDELEKQQEQQKQEDLQKQIDDLKAQQDEQSKQGQQPQVVVQNSPASAAPEGVVVVSPDIVANTDLEAAALDAAISYYQAVEVGDYTYTYSALSSADQNNYTYDQWLYANNSLDSAAAEFEVFRTMVDSPNTAIVEGYEHVADVGASIYYPDGSLSTRYTFFVYEGRVASAQATIR